MSVSQVLNSLYLVNPLLAAGNFPLLYYTHYYTYCHGTEMLVLTQKTTMKLARCYTNTLTRKL